MAVAISDSSIAVPAAAPRSPEPIPPGPASSRGSSWVAAHIGLAWPAGDFPDVAERGFGADFSVHWPWRRNLTFGALADLTQFGGKRDFEQFLAANTSGEVDQLHYTVFGLSGVLRYAMLRERSSELFAQGALGIRSFKTTVSGPNVRGSNSGFTLSPDIGVGVRLKLRKDLWAELLGLYTIAAIAEGFTSADGAAVYSQGTAQYFQIRAGISRPISFTSTR